MCIVFWTLEHPDYSLILCTNRDEFLDRPTKDAHFHSFEHEAGVHHGRQDAGKVLSGRDEMAGGTWLGLSRSGRVSVLTNITEPPSEQAFSSRGHLVSTFLLSDSSHPLEDEVEKIILRGVRYAGFNLLLLAPESDPAAGEPLRFGASLVSNGGAGGTITSRPVTNSERICGGFSNGVDGHGGSEWPKVQHGLKAFEAAVQTQSGADEAEVADRLFEVLALRQIAGALQNLWLSAIIYGEPSTSQRSPSHWRHLLKMLPRRRAISMAPDSLQLSSSAATVKYWSLSAIYGNWSTERQYYQTRRPKESSGSRLRARVCRDAVKNYYEKDTRVPTSSTNYYCTTQSSRSIDSKASIKVNA
ncbi:hypothetical protein HGRIS_006457 [Hohenbuehelia grisea]|uniref:Uncharacterized protein n=1 Tax=Hohenbuehelia grisea TaxID=104357 RepID=A0ABR3K0F3_9AGAR